jgi:CLIP-associating protein 1/2
MLPGASLPRPRKSSDGGPGLPLSTPDRGGARTTRKPGGVSQSQPGSRSASPSSLKSYQTYFDTIGSPGYASATKSPRKRSNNGPFDLLDNSDESETSSLCSEKSFDYGRPRPSDDISEIIANCASTHWADRKDGLIGLQSYFRDGRMLSGTELRRVTEIFTKMFMDAHTKVFALFLETLCELVTSHKADLYDWLYVLLTRLLNKLGADLLGSVVHKINRTLDVVRESFSYEEQLVIIFKYMTDQTQTPNSKVKLATLYYLKSLITLVESADIPNNKEAEMAVAKLITWTSDPKSPEIRRAASMSLTSMFNTHTPQMNEILRKLPQMYQDTAVDLLEKGGAGESPLKLSGPSPMKPRSLQPPHTGGRARISPLKPIHPDESENMNPDEVNKSLRLTANAIQNYSFERTDKMRSDMPDEKDSGISQVSDGGGMNIEEKLAALELDRLEGGRVSNGRSGIIRPPAAMDDMLYGSNDSVSRGESKEKDGKEGKSMIQDIIATLQAVKTGTQGVERRACMTQLIKIARNGPNQSLLDQFRSVLRVLLENLEDEDGSTRALVFGVLTEMLKQDSLQAGFQGFTELVILKVLQAHKDPEKDVVRAAESCAATMAGVLPAEMVVRVLNPIIKTGDFPVNQAAIKMLTKLVERQTPESISHHLADVMPGLLKAYDNVESSVRKAAVFCIVALHQLVGEGSLQPHLDCLNGSKMKLLSLYIKRAQAQSTQTSPRLTPS